MIHPPEFEHTQAGGARPHQSRLIAVIRVDGCTGCAVCLEFCPVDCMYVVPGPEYGTDHLRADLNPVVAVDEDACIGCRLCAKYCPWDTIDMVERETASSAAA